MEHHIHLNFRDDRVTTPRHKLYIFLSSMRIIDDFIVAMLEAKWLTELFSECEWLHAEFSKSIEWTGRFPYCWSRGIPHSLSTVSLKAHSKILNSGRISERIRSCQIRAPSLACKRDSDTWKDSGVIVIRWWAFVCKWMRSKENFAKLKFVASALLLLE